MDDARYYTGENNMVLKVMQKSVSGRFVIGFCKIATIVLAFVSSFVLTSCAGPAVTKDAGSVTKRAEALSESQSVEPFMGDWGGSWRLGDGSQSGGLVAQVIALGKGKYRANLLDVFDQRVPPIAVFEGELQGGKLPFVGRAEYEGAKLQVLAVIEAGKFTGDFKGQTAEGDDVSGTLELEKTVRLSPTLGAKPPAGAIVLFDGKNFDQWERIGTSGGKADKKEVRWKLLPGGAMEVAPGGGSIVTKKKFTDFNLHIEFRTPFMPDARGQGRGNSGVYLQGRYEIQVLDSYGLEGLDNECGGLYTIAAPRVNMCALPMQWQTYDITFRAPRFDSAGAKLSDALLTVVHNGVKIHDKIKVPGPTGGALDGNVSQPGGIYLQDHGNPVQFRNIWLVELKLKT
jgi:hypothetical protein